MNRLPRNLSAANYMKGNEMTRKEEIAVIKRCEKAIYDGWRRLRYNINIRADVLQGMIRAENLLYDKRHRLEKKLKR